MRAARHATIACLLVVAAAAPGCGGEEVVSVQGDPAAGEELAGEIAQPTCGVCHTLAAAEFTGETAPDLDEREPGYDTVLSALRDGPGAMPSYTDQFDESELHDIAAFISGSAGERITPAPGGEEPEDEDAGEPAP